MLDLIVLMPAAAQDDLKKAAKKLFSFWREALRMVVVLTIFS